MNKKNLYYFFIMFVVFFASLSMISAAEKYPTKAIQLVTANPGGFIDITARLLTPILEKNLGVPIVVNNRTGGGGAVATHFVIKSKPDGYTIGSISSADTVVLPATTPDVPFKFSDLDPLCKYAVSPTLLFCKADAPWKTLEELIADAKKRPRQIVYGSTVSGTSELLIKGFIMDAGIDMRHVPMENAAQTIPRTLGGNLDLGVVALTPLVSHIKAGTVRVLFISTSERIRTFPQIPTLKEKGYGVSVINLYTGFFAPVGMQKPIRETLEKALEKTIGDTALKERTEGVGAVLDYLPGEAFAKEIEEDYNKVIKIIKTLKLYK